MPVTHSDTETFAAAITETVTPAPATAGGTTVGTAALPFSSVFIGNAATNNLQLTGTAAAARAITFADPGGAATVAYTNSTTTPQVVSGLQSFTGNKSVMTANFTSANASGLQAITGAGTSLSFALPAVAANYVFHCSIQYSQATNVSGDQFGVASLTTAATRIDAGSIVATNATAVQQGFVNNLTSTTPTAIVTFQPAVSTELTAVIDGTIQASGLGTSTLQFYVTNGTAADVIVISAGSYCTLM